MFSWCINSNQLTQLLLGCDTDMETFPPESVPAVSPPTLVHSVLGLWTQPARSLRMQQAVSRSFSRASLISRDSVSSHRMHGAYFAPRWISVVCKKVV